ncbi:hypothetical protein LTR62_006086 [Meristemomyces frigidus]|uniref:Delta(24)-sterol reductase n=1 Tax=Meristemomyces frigidus TaxID=1508187 RepID=A0AAN7TNY2_9PEZI|nr:hypothetical protein LTR62_006086 [Meristemomyces frigidus]
MEAHQHAVARISSQISTFYQRQEPFRLYHGSTNSTQSRKVDPKRMVDTSALTHVLKVNKESKTCLVESNVPMDKLVDATIPHGLVPPVITEFPGKLGITVGGAFAGTAGESSGFKHGFFDSSVNWIEIVLATGQIVTASSTEHSDLFYAAAGSFGTLGVMTMMEIQCIDASQYVKLRYQPTIGIRETLRALQEACSLDAGNDYVDGILLSRDRGVIISGNLTDDVPSNSRIQRFARASDPWHYIHADRITSHSDEAVEELTPLRDYLFRYDRGAFWTGRYAFQYFLVPFNRITRYLLDYFMHTRVMYHALHASGLARQYMIQDLLLPTATAQEFIEDVATELDFWPLWLCPFRSQRAELALHPRLRTTKHPSQSINEDQESEREATMYINIGVWGPASTTYSTFIQQNRSLEAKVRELEGVKWLYAQAYYTEEEFDEIYDRGWYENLREKYGATHLPTVFEKTRVDLPRTTAVGTSTWESWFRGKAWEMWPVSGLYGVWKAVSAREYLLAK